MQATFDTCGLIEQIQALNPTAGVGSLSGFDRDTLASYLDRLSRVGEPRGPQSAWSRVSQSPAITRYVPTGS